MNELRKYIEDVADEAFVTGVFGPGEYGWKAALEWAEEEVANHIEVDVFVDDNGL